QDGELSVGLGAGLYHLDRFGEARDWLNAARHQAPDDPHARYYLGLTLLSLGELERAKQEIEAAVLARPDDARYLVAKGQVLERERRPREAVQQYARAAQL